MNCGSFYSGETKLNGEINFESDEQVSLQTISGNSCNSVSVHHILPDV